MSSEFFNPFTFFNEKEWSHIEELWNEIIVDFYQETEVNPFANIDFYPIENYLKTLGQFSDEQIKEMTDQIYNQLV